MQHAAPSATPQLHPALAEFRGKVARLVEITGRADPASRLTPEQRALLNKEYRLVLAMFDEAVAQLPATQAAAVEREQ